MPTAKDINRIRTFLAYKGFQLEPLSDSSQTTFTALKAEEASFAGVILSMGKERSCDDRPISIETDAAEKTRLQTTLARQLGAGIRQLSRTSGASGLPVVAIMVNHDPRLQFEDLADVVRGSSDTSFPSIDLLLIWFDDFRSDQLLFRRADPVTYKKFQDWFGEA